MHFSWWNTVPWTVISISWVLLCPMLLLALLKNGTEEGSNWLFPVSIDWLTFMDWLVLLTWYALSGDGQTVAHLSIREEGIAVRPLTWGADMDLLMDTSAAVKLSTLLWGPNVSGGADNTNPPWNRCLHSWMWQWRCVCERLHTFTVTFRAFSRRFYPKWLSASIFCQKKERQQNIAIGKVRMFIEPSGKH